MKRYVLAMVAALTFSFGCGEDPEVEVVETPFMEIAGYFIADLTITDNKTNEVLYDDTGNVRVFQSGGAATSWAGAIGTAKENKIIIDAAWSIAAYDLSLVGVADRKSGTFDYTFRNAQGELSLHYVFKDVRDRGQALTSGHIPEIDFVADAERIVFVGF